MARMYNNKSNIFTIKILQKKKKSNSFNNQVVKGTT